MKDKCDITYYFQLGQDRMVLDYFKFKRRGFYVDIGVHDGKSFSNTKCMEEMGWNGVCIEPNPEVYERLCHNRDCACLNVAISDTSGKALFTKITGHAQMLSGLSADYCEAHKERVKCETEENHDIVEEIEVMTMTFNDLLEQILETKELLKDSAEVSELVGEGTVDFVSIDTEGSEFKILQSIDFQKYKIQVLAVENAYNDEAIRQYMRKKGYICKRLEYDDIFIRAEE